MTEKFDFLQVGKLNTKKNSFLLILRSFFSAYGFLRRVGFFELVLSQRNFFTKIWGLWLASTKSYSTSCKSTNFGRSWLPKSNLKVDFLNIQAKMQNILGQCPGGSCLEHSVKSWEIYLHKGADAGSGSFASPYFPKSVNLPSCYFAGRPFVSC